MILCLTTMITQGPGITCIKRTFQFLFLVTLLCMSYVTSLVLKDSIWSRKIFLWTQKSVFVATKPNLKETLNPFLDVMLSLPWSMSISSWQNFIYFCLLVPPLDAATEVLRKQVCHNLAFFLTPKFLSPLLD